MRRASYTPLPTQAPSEPLIVVEESGNTDDEGGGDSAGDSRPASPPPGMDSPLLNPCLLSPYRDMRKRSLPTPACTSGITASQVRRLSEHGVGTEGAVAREAAFLATLQAAPAPAPGGRRHSVVTISRAPPPSILFGRGRRESIAAFPAAGAGAARVLPPRRDSVSSVPPRPPAASSASAGSTHNLALDIMDDIAEIKAARKVRLKMWRTPSRERVCEVQPLDGAGAAASAAGPSGAGAQAPTRYQSRGADSGGSRRYSDFVTAPATTALIPAPAAQQRRRASELPPASAAAAAQAKGVGIVCTNSDLISILSSLASSAQEINRDPEDGARPGASASSDDSPHKKTAGAGSEAGAGAGCSAEQKRSRLKSLRSNSFDVSMLLGPGGGKQPGAQPAQQPAQGAAHGRSGSAGPASWFVKRHTPRKASETLRPAPGTGAAVAEPPPPQPAAAGTTAGPAPKVVWDGRSGSVVDAQVLGSAIEDFLSRRGSGNDSPSPSGQATATPGGGVAPVPGAGAVARGSPGGKSAGGSWFSAVAGKDEEESGASDTCDSSICSTLKDLFVK